MLNCNKLSLDSNGPKDWQHTKCLKLLITLSKINRVAEKQWHSTLGQNRNATGFNITKVLQHTSEIKFNILNRSLMSQTLCSSQSLLTISLLNRNQQRCSRSHLQQSKIEKALYDFNFWILNRSPANNEPNFISFDISFNERL